MSKLKYGKELDGMTNNAVFLTCNSINADGCHISEKNGLLKKLKCVLPQNCKALFICSNPDSYEITDKYGNSLCDSFAVSGIVFSKLMVLDRRNENLAGEFISTQILLF